MPVAQIVVGLEADGGLRIDTLLGTSPNLPNRSQLRLRSRLVTLNGRRVKLSHRAYPGDVVAVDYDDPVPQYWLAQPIDLVVLYEDDDIVVIDKPQGMVVHPGNGVFDGTVVQGLAYRYEGIRRQRDAEPLRPGIVHRLDRETSGVMIAAQHSQSCEWLLAQFRGRHTAKTYIAIVKGAPRANEGTIDAPITRDLRNRVRFTIGEGGKPATTHYRIIRRFEAYSFVALYPVTGRTHQLRVHLRSIGCPIVGDPLYARVDSRLPDARLMLHAYRLQIAPYPNEMPRLFRAPIPIRFRRLLATLRE